MTMPCRYFALLTASLEGGFAEMERKKGIPRQIRKRRMKKRIVQDICGDAVAFVWVRTAEVSGRRRWERIGMSFTCPRGEL